MDENELKENERYTAGETDEAGFDFPTETEETEAYGYADEDTDAVTDADAEVDAVEESAAAGTGSTGRAKTEEELAAENEALCDEALTTEKFCVTYKLRFKDLAKFNLRYSLLGLNSVMFWLVLAIGIAYLATAWTELGGQKRALIIVLLVFLIWYVPIRALINAAKSAAYLQKQSMPTEYHACEEGFVICQEGQRGLLQYKKISRLQETRSTLYAYVFRNSGFIFPRDLVGDRYEDLKALLRSRAGRK